MRMVMLLVLAFVVPTMASAQALRIGYVDMKEVLDNAPQVVADALNNAGLIYWCWGQRADALRAFKRALSLRKQTGDMFGLAATLMNIGMVREQMGAVGSARRSYESAHVLASRICYLQARSCLSVSLTLPTLATRPVSLRPRSINIRCSASSFGS